MNSESLNQRARLLHLVKAHPATRRERCSAAGVNAAAMLLLYQLNHLTKSDQKRVMKRALRLLGE